MTQQEIMNRLSKIKLLLKASSRKLNTLRGKIEREPLIDTYSNFEQDVLGELNYLGVLVGSTKADIERIGYELLRKIEPSLIPNGDDEWKDDYLND